MVSEILYLIRVDSLDKYIRFSESMLILNFYYMNITYYLGLLDIIGQALGQALIKEERSEYLWSGTTWLTNIFQ